MHTVVMSAYGPNQQEIVDQNSELLSVIIHDECKRKTGVKRVLRLINTHATVFTMSLTHFGNEVFRFPFMVRTRLL